MILNYDDVKEKSDTLKEALLCELRAGAQRPPVVSLSKAASVMGCIRKETDVLSVGSASTIRRPQQPARCCRYGPT